MANSLYLDTNIYLSFYHLSSDDLKELQKLSVLTRTGEITLYIPEQTINEFYRNRDSKIADAKKRFSENKLDRVFPQIVKEYGEEYELMKSALITFEKNKQIIIDKIDKDHYGKNFKADKIIKEIFECAKIIKTTPELINKAITRYNLGNPPGKKNSYGDALNWESLLSEVGVFENFYFISVDGDYDSEFNKEFFNSFLLKEWEEKIPLTDFKYYHSLSKFFKEKYPEINIENELLKEQLNDILKAAISNTQIFWIGKDQDISQFLHTILDGRISYFKEEDVEQFKIKFPKFEEVGFDTSLPF